MSDATVDGLAFREAIAHFATGVTVVTTNHEGRPAGMTASAVCSLSLDPVLLVVCIDNRLATHKAIDASKRFAVNVLGERDEELARRFARRAEDKFAGVDAGRRLRSAGSRQGHRALRLHRARARARRRSLDLHRQVLHCEATPGRRPLLYYRSAFGAIRDPDAEFLEEAGGWDAGSVGGLGHFHVRPR